MKKVKKLILLVTIPIFSFALVIGLYFLIPHLTVTPVESGQVLNSSIYTIKNGLSNVFFIKIDNDYIMFDAGSDANKLAASMAEVGIKLENVKWIFITHSDYDHVAGLSLFPNAKIYMGADELPLINGTKKRFIVFKDNSLSSGVKKEKITFLHTEELLIGEILVESIIAPGHTIGSMVYLVNGKYLITGDAFRVSNGNIENHPFPMDRRQSKKTIEQLKDIINRSSIILTSHYGYYERLSFDKI